MSYILAQIFVCLLIAGLIGLMIGWLLAKTSYAKKAKELEELWRVKVVDIKEACEDEIKALSLEHQKNLEEYHSKYQDKEKSLISDIGVYKSKSLDSENRLSRAENDLIVKNRKVVELEKALDDAKRIEKDLRYSYEQKLERLEKELEKLKEKEKNDKELSDNINKKLSKLEDEKRYIEAKLKAANSIINDLDKKYKDEMEQSQESLKVFSQKLNSLEDRITRDNTQWEQKLKGVIKDFEIRRSSLERTIDSLRDKANQKDEFESKLGEYHQRLHTYQKDLEDKDKNCHSLEMELKREKEHCHDLSKKSNILQMQLEKQNSLMKKLEDEISSYRDHIQKLTKETKQRDEIWRQRIENLLKGN